jgi:ABC-type nitrate/sulfonate/bicarbonate transport system permease component
MRIGIVGQFWAIALLLAAWEAWVLWMGYNAIVLPRPSAVFADLLRSPGLYVAPAGATLGTALLGLALGMAFGTALAVAGWLSRFLQGAFTPLTVLFSSVPVVTIIPILARIFGYDRGTALVVVVIISFFPAFVFATAGLRQLPPLADDLFRVLGAQRVRRLLLLAVPAAVPALCVALRIAAAHAILAAMVAEYLMGTGGLGYILVDARSDLNMERALGASIVAILLSIALYASAYWVEAAVRERWS